MIGKSEERRVKKLKKSSMADFKDQINDVESCIEQVLLDLEEYETLPIGE